jgi:predicted Ser/Thr protein kinase/tetratricopeptide (TPR) repeat protein
VNGEPLGERVLQRLLAIAAEPEAPTRPPELPPRYEIVRELGRGGMGVVYEVIDHQLGRRCALKTLGAGANDELRRRFAREATSAARLRHPNIAAVHDATPEYLTMQLIDGGPIGHAPQLDRRAAVRLVHDAALALQHAHDQGIVHRDIKPSNLLVERDRVFVVDFGLAKATDAAHSVSLQGAVVGTPAFMPPEQALGHTALIDARSDVYGLGATLWYCLHGAPPFAAADLPSLLRAVVDDEPARVVGDRDLDLVLQKCLAKEREHRYASARDLADDLARWLRDEPVLARRPSLLWRLQKRLRRQRTLWRAAGLAAIATALVLVPIALRESAARSAANEAVKLADHVATVLQDGNLLLALGDQEGARRRIAGGIDEVHAFLRSHDVPRVRYLLARLLLAASRPDDALVELDITLADEPTLADARFERGLLLAARSDPDAATRTRAIEDLGVEVRERSVLRDVDRLFGKAELARLRGEHGRAEELLREVIEYDGMHVRARLSLAAVARARGDHDLSRYYSASALDLQQGYGPFYLARERRALPTQLLGLDGFLVDYGADLAEAPDNAGGLAHRAVVHLRRALRLEGEGDLAAAIDAAGAAVADHDHVLTLHDVAGAYNNRAVCRLVQDRLLAKAGRSAEAAAAWRAAEADVTKALETAPSMPEAHANAGLCALRAATVLRSLGRAADASARAEAAVAAFDRAVAAAPASWPRCQACQRHRDAANLLR